LFFIKPNHPLFFCDRNVSDKIYCSMLFSLIRFNIKKTPHTRGNRKGNHEWTIHRNWQYWEHKTKDEDKQKQHRELKR
jgi:hypothetical protein